MLLVANVGEEGEGNLSGMRYLCRSFTELAESPAILVLDGPSVEHVTTQALSSRRYEITFTGPGGHSWNDYGTPNPVHALGHVISSFTNAAREHCMGLRKSRCSYNFGIIEGGASVNSIPASALAKLDLRSEDPANLEEFSALLTAAVEQALERENRNTRNIRLAAKIKELGARPGGKLPPAFTAADDDSGHRFASEYPLAGGLRLHRRQHPSLAGPARYFHRQRRRRRRRAYAA